MYTYIYMYLSLYIYIYMYYIYVCVYIYIIYTCMYYIHKHTYMIYIHNKKMDQYICIHIFTLFAYIYMYMHRYIQLTSAISNTLYLGTFSKLNFSFGLFSILINFLYKSVQYLELCYLELSLCQTIFWFPSIIFGLFPIHYLKHSNEVLEWIILFISVIQILITALTKLCSEVCSFFFSTSFRQHVLI